jgi:hypothetical protein
MWTNGADECSTFMLGIFMPSQNPLRRYLRFRTDVRARLSFRDGNGQSQSIIARTIDLSIAGLSVYAPLELPFDTDVILEFTIPGDSVPMCLGAMVRNRHGFRYGLQFQPMSRAEKLRLSAFVRQLQIDMQLEDSAPKRACSATYQP